MKRYLLWLLAGLFYSFSSFAQADDINVECREKCSHASTAKTTQIEYYQDFSSMNHYNQNYLKLDVDVEPNSQVISGTALYYAKAVQAVDTFTMEFRSTMIVDSVFINGVKKASFQSNDHVYVPLMPNLPPNSNITALYYFHGSASGSAIFSGTDPSGLVYTASLSESYQAREWYPAKQVLSDKLDSLDVWITTASPNMAGSNGLLKATVVKPNNKIQYQWSCRYPINYYLPSVSVGNYMQYLNYAKPTAMAPDSILVQHYLPNSASYLASVKTNLDKTPRFIEKMSDLFGLYPFKNEKYGHCYAGIPGGMEHQTMSTVDGFGSTLIAHELCHQWFGDNVTCATWNDIWLNEGFASYGEYLMVEQLPALFTTTTPAAYMLSFHNSVLSSTTGSVYVPLASTYDENRIFSSRLSYNKGAAIIHTLRFEMQDDSKFWQTLQTYQQQYGGSVATAANFKVIAESVTGKNFTDFFNEWYYGEGYPTISADYTMQGVDTMVLTVNMVPSAPTITPVFKGLYEYKILSNQGDTTVKFYQTANNQQFKFKYTKLATGVLIDPNNWVLNKVGAITTGVNDIQNISNDVKLFPSPASKFAYLEFPQNSFSRIELLDVEGRELKQWTVSGSAVRQQLHLDLPSGIFIVRLTGKNRTAVKKLVVR